MNLKPPLASGRLIARNSIYNILGEGAPLIAAVVALPFLVRGLGAERLGVVAILWAIESTAGMFDLGLGKALTRDLSECLTRGDHDEIPQIFQTAFWLIFLSSVVVAAVFGISAPWIVRTFIRIAPLLKRESIRAIYILCCSIPFLITITAFRAVFAALQRFDLENAVRVPIGISLFLLPVLTTLKFSKSLTVFAGAIVAIRAVEWLIRAAISLRLIPGLKRIGRFQLSSAVTLTSFGGWIAASNAITRSLIYCDRLIIANTLSVSALTYYVAPFEIAFRLKLIPASVMRTLFPALVASLNTESHDMNELIERSTKQLLMVLFPPTFLIVTFAPELLNAWLGPVFAERSSFLLQWFAIGVLINSVGDPRWEMIQSANRADAVAKLLLIEAPIYLLLLVGSIKLLGLSGVAIAWAARSLFQTLALYVMSARLVPNNGLNRNSDLSTLAACVVILVLASAIPAGFIVKLLLVGAFLTALFVVSWTRLLSPDERHTLKTILWEV